MLCMLYGDETYLLESKLKKIKKEFGELINGINFVQLDEGNISEIISNLETPAFGYPRKLIIAKNTGLFKKEKKSKDSKKSKETKDSKLGKENKKKENYKSYSLQDRIADYILEHKDLFKADVTLVFVEEDAEKNGLYKAIEETGEIFKFDLLKFPELIENTQKICKAYKVNIAGDTARYFVENTGASMQDLINEIRKLIEYSGENGTITKADIDKLCIKQIDSVIFDLTDSLGKKDIKKSLQVLNDLIYEKEPIQKILITLYNHFKKLFIVKKAEKYNKDISQAMNLKPNQMFLVSKYKAQARFFDEGTLRKILQEFIDLDENYKIGKIDLELGLQAILCAYCG